MDCRTHYLAAEELIGEADLSNHRDVLIAAQVHALLAVVAAIKDASGSPRWGA